jgi:photosystem II protein
MIPQAGILEILIVVLSSMAEIQFIRGVNEEVVPDVRLTRARDGSSGQAMFYFDNPKIVQEGNLEITGMYMVDEEGEIVTRDVNAKFINGQPVAIEATYSMRSLEQWERFIRFMDRYAASHGLGFQKS